ASWQWETSDYNASCLSCGSDVEYMGQITPLSEGTYHWGARVRYDSGPWQYCDRSDDGLEGSTDGWTPQTAPSLIVSRDLRVVTLNLRCLLDDFASRLPLIVDTLTASDADLIGVQEVCTEDGPLGHDNLTEIINALSTRTGKQYQIVRTVTHRSWDTYDEGIALVTPHAIIDESETSLPMGAFLRKVVMARVETPLGTVIMATTHLDHLDAQTRVDQATAAISALTAFNSLSEPLILTGDFNEGPDAVVHSLMTDAGFSDLWSNLYPLDPGYTFPMPAPDIRIDYIWLNHKITPLSISRILDTPVAGVTGSDHAGLSGTVGVQ
ncbi:endonuclease/exonuclease/phosphatase family protein, partial [Myxococcota bacterium]|nr:endonuclease/exonuclease/phosphatase family protein [Myxococcota bacterium]